MRSEQFYAVTFFFISILIILFLVFPQYQNLSSLKERVADFETALKNQEDYFQRLKKTASDLERYKDSLLKIDSALPSNPSLPELFNFIQKLCSQSGLALSKIGSISTTPLPQGQLKETRTEITVSGSYSDFKNFLSALEKSARLIEVENISFASQEKDPLAFSLKIKIYSY
jgi:Tfp pilus assembly protein PilO